jgi:uncharacterized protein
MILPNIFIIHGTESSPQSNWIPWLKSELNKLGYQAIAPQFPTPQNQSLDSWMEEFKNYEYLLNENSIVIGHSLAPAFLLSIIEKNNVRGAIFVAGFVGLLGNEHYDSLNKTFVAKEFRWDKIRENCKKFIIINSDNDPFVPLERGRELAEKTGGEFIVLNNAGHINAPAGYKTFPLLLKKINEIQGRY